MKKISAYISALVIGAAVLPSCSDNWEEPALAVPTFPQGFEANITIKELKEKYWQSSDSYGTPIGLLENGDTAVIVGTIVSTTTPGNIYKALYLQDATGAICIGIDTTAVSKALPMGIAMGVKATGLTIGRYNGLMQMGKSDGSGVNRITMPELRPHIALDYYASKLDTTTVTIDQLLEAAKTDEGKIEWQSRLVRIDKVKFAEAGQPFTNGSTTSRYIVDESGKRMIVYNSSYADFAYDELPYGTGSVVGVLSCYRASWQLLLNDVDGLIDFDGEGKPDTPDTPAEPVKPEGEGTAASPYNVTKALDIIKAGTMTEAEVYVKGTIESIKEIDTSYGNATYNINDGTGLPALTIYRGYWMDGAKFTSENQLEVGKEVVVRGKLVLYGSTSEMAQGNRVISYDGHGGNTPDTPTGDAYTLINEANENGLDGWTVNNTEIWTWKTYNGKSYLNGSAFNLPLAADAWAVSPKVKLGEGSAAVSFEHAAKFQDAGLRTNCTINIREAGATEWTKLAIPTWPEAGAWTWASSGTIDLSAFAGKTVEIGFCYGLGCTDTWEIRNLTFVNAAAAVE